MRDDLDGGLELDLATLLNRRLVLGAVAGVGLAALAGCADAVTGAKVGVTGKLGQGALPESCETIPQETAGPYPGDGSNGPNALTQSGIVRSDITSSFGGATGVAEGVSLSVSLTVQDAATCGPLAGAAVYLWQCNREGQYSMYSQGIENENYLRGLQQTDTNGVVTFSSIFPGCYDGRWPHIHFEVYPSLAEATAAGTMLRTSQLALPEDACDAVYATDGYSASVDNLARVSLATDMVFSDDDGARQLATVTGSPTTGMTASLTVPVAA